MRLHRRIEKPTSTASEVGVTQRYSIEKPTSTASEVGATERLTPTPECVSNRLYILNPNSMSTFVSASDLSIRMTLVPSLLTRKYRLSN